MDVTAYGAGDWRERVGPEHVSPLDDRRQRAREAFWDAVVDVGAREAAEGAIETATRVKITNDVVAKFRAAAGGWGGNFAVALAVALAELGFEVEE